MNTNELEHSTVNAEICKKLNFFIENKKIPNIIFHGVSGCGKSTIAWNFVKAIYNNDKIMKDYVMHVNCAHGKGIRFVREELKFFAKTNVDLKDGDIFKSIILLNADKLTTDAQSALRRCIELFSHTTRFFIVVEDKCKLLRPILSRFCEIHVEEPIINGSQINLHKYFIEKTFSGPSLEKLTKQRNDWLEKTLLLKQSYTVDDIINLSNKLYEKAYNSMDLLKWLEQRTESEISSEQKYEKLISFEKIRHEFRNEKLIMLFMLHFILLRSNDNLENISFM
jgi:DNA polymerase III delta prime subunit